MMRPLITIDCETDPFKPDRMPVPFLWDAYDGQKHYTCSGVDELLRYLSGRKSLVYAHNGGRFDFLMPGFLDSISDKQQIKIINGRLASFTIGENEFRDSMLIFPESLKSFCKLEIDYCKSRNHQIPASGYQEPLRPGALLPRHLRTQPDHRRRRHAVVA
jgi:hypothetical protein